MKAILTIALLFIPALSLLSQEDKIEVLVSEGTTLNDQGKYDEAIAKYKEALEIDKNSTLANYELSYTYMAMARYDDAIKYSKKVIDLNASNQQGAYIILGSSLDMKGKSAEAIKVYEEGLTKFPISNLLNYNLALTAYNSGETDKAEKAAINAIRSKPTHGSSHLILANVMMNKGERVKAMLSLYYFLMVEPNSKRSASNYKLLKNLINQGVEKQGDNKINVTVPSFKSGDSTFSPAEMMVSLNGATRYTEKNKEKTEIEFFVETTKSLFSILGELKKNNTGFWWDFYVPKFYDLIQTNNYEAFSYYISQSTNETDVNQWTTNNPEKIQLLKEWMKK